MAMLWPFTMTLTRLPASDRMCWTSTSSSRSLPLTLETALPVALGNDTLPLRLMVRWVPPPLAEAAGAIATASARQAMSAVMNVVRCM